MVQFKLEIQDEELKNLKGQYLKTEEKLSKLRMTRLHQYIWCLDEHEDSWT
jgi:hypothetical protein